MKKVYHEGKLIPAKNWDYTLKKPKVKKKESIKVEEELPLEVQQAIEEWLM